MYLVQMSLCRIYRGKKMVRKATLSFQIRAIEAMYGIYGQEVLGLPVSATTPAARQFGPGRSRTSSLKVGHSMTLVYS